jgi:hypothetical protein
VLYNQNPTAIIWTQTEPAYESSIYDQVRADIHTIGSWIERELDLARIRELGDNWDGFEAAAPDPGVLDRASLLLRLLRKRDFANPPARVALSPRGSIALEWLAGNAFLRAEIGDSEGIEWMLAIPGQATEFRFESLVPSAFERVEGQEWKPAPAPVGEPAYASVH